MNLSCYIIDDEYHSVEILRAYVEKTPGLVLKGFSTDPLTALRELTSGAPPAICFADIDMPHLSGIELAGMVPRPTKLVFTTSHPEYAVEAFEKDACDYLMKPISYERFLRAITRIRNRLIEPAGGSPDPGYFFVTTDVKGKMAKVATATILFVEAQQHYMNIVTTGGKLLAYLTMDEILRELPAGRFLRTHRSFIVNTGKIRTVEHGQLTLDDSCVIPIGRMYRENVLNLMKERLLQSGRKAGS